MRTVATLIIGAIATVMVGAIVAYSYLRATGLSTRAQPGALEAAAARTARRMAIPADFRTRRNPISLTPEALADGMAHFADHCASCHANDGSGDTEMGRGFFPKAPDMRRPETQRLSDGELFYVIEHGIRFTGMPAWGNGTPAGRESSWRLVHFIRHLPSLTAEELERMKQLNPRPPDEIRQEIEEERFLSGGA